MCLAESTDPVKTLRIESVRSLDTRLSVSGSSDSGDHVADGNDADGAAGKSSSRPTIRVRADLAEKRASRPAPPSRPLVAKPSLRQLDVEVGSLREEVRVLQWMSQKKEQEWDRILGLLRRKEELLAKAERAHRVASAEAAYKAKCLEENAGANMLTISLEVPAVAASSHSTAQTRSLLISNSKPVNGAVASAAASSSPAATPSSTSTSPVAVVVRKCQTCKTLDSRFECSGCNRAWYCSKNCQVADWEEHSDACDQT